MSEVKVRVGEMELRTCKLTKSLLKQLPVLSYETMRGLVTDKGHIKEECVVGWVHGSVLGDEHSRWLILKIAEGEYGRYDAMQSTITQTGAKQLYIV